MSFSEFSVWTFIMAIAVLLFSMLLSSALKQFIPFLRKSLIPVSVLGGIILLIVSTITYYAAGEYLFNLTVFGGNGSGDSYSGMEVLEMITYHCLGIGFIATGLRSSKKKFTKQRAGEIFDSGVVTVNGYLIQGFVGAGDHPARRLRVQNGGNDLGRRTAFGVRVRAGHGAGAQLRQDL